MILYVNTTPNDFFELGLKDNNKFIVKKKFNSKRTQAEKLLPTIDKLLKASKLKLKDIKGIEVASRGGSFTSLRIGVVTANSLAYALGIAVTGEGRSRQKRNSGRLKLNPVKPEYESSPVITVKKRKI